MPHRNDQHQKPDEVIWFFTPPPCPTVVDPTDWAMACDREWFDHHPAAADYWRRVIPGEAPLKGTDLLEPCCAWRLVQVTRLAAGMRTRLFVHVTGVAA